MSRELGGVGVLAVALVCAAAARAQSCTTQAKMTPELYGGLSEAAMGLASAVKAGDAAQIQTATVPEFAANFAPTAYLVRTTGERIAGDKLKVSQVYGLDATRRTEGDTGDAEFTCPLVGTASETDFSIPALPKGEYGFVMVEATGDRPWLLSFLLKQDGAMWRVAGLYLQPRTAAGRDGVAFWSAARAAVKAQQPWLAWVLYGEADALLRPAKFITSTNLDKLVAERVAAAPPELGAGLSAESPLVVKGADGVEYRFTGIGSEGSEDGKLLDLNLHVVAGGSGDAAAAKAYTLAAAKAMLDAHKELRKGFDEVWVFAETTGQLPVATELKMSEVP